MTKYFLESTYFEPTRPYSQKELAYLRKDMRHKLKLGSHLLLHSKCKHFYYLKNNSRKEKEVVEQNKHVDIGNCSVCWKLSKTPRHLTNTAYNLIDDISLSELRNEVDNHEEKVKLSYDLLDLETVYYKWLYLDDF